MKGKLKYDNIETIKILIIAETCVGGTSFRYSFIRSQPELNNYAPMIFDYLNKEIILSNGEKVNVFIYNGPKQERFRSIIINHIKYSEGILLMYDTTNHKSFEEIDYWMEKIEDKVGPNFPIVLIGTKIDLEYYRVISKEEGEKKAKQYDLHFYESSSSSYINIEEPVYDLAEQIFQIKQKKKKEYDINLKNNKNLDTKNNIPKDNLNKSDKINKEKNIMNKKVYEKLKENIFLEKLYFKYTKC